MAELLLCENVYKSFGGKRVLQGLNLQVSGGRIVGLLGPNGSGKTTLMKLINGLLVPNQGKILVNGFAPGPESKKRVSYLPDASYLPDWMQVQDLVKMFADFYADFDAAKAAEMLQTLKISGTERLKTLSKGTKEKVQLILAMSRRAELYLLDEPIGGVDPAAVHGLHGPVRHPDDRAADHDVHWAGQGVPVHRLPAEGDPADPADLPAAPVL